MNLSWSSGDREAAQAIFTQAHRVPTEGLQEKDWPELGSEIFRTTPASGGSPAHRPANASLAFTDPCSGICRSAPASLVSDVALESLLSREDPRKRPGSS